MVAAPRRPRLNSIANGYAEMSKLKHQQVRKGYLMQSLSDSKSSQIISGAAGVLLGLVFLANPAGLTVMAVRIVGWLAIAAGVLGLVLSFRDLGTLATTPDLVFSVAGLALGMLLNWAPGFFVSWVIVLLGLFVLLSGFSKLSAAGVLGSAGVPGMSLALVAAILEVALGALMMISPFALVSFAGTVAGIALLATGIGELARAFRG